MRSQQIYRKRFLVAFFNFLLIASIGTLLRYVFIHEVKIIPDYKNVLQAHSHVAMMGWVFMALFGSLLYSFSPETSGRKIYKVLFWSNQVAAMILILNFWLNGYDNFSITISTVYIIVAYIFVFKIFRDAKNGTSNRLSIHLLYLCLFFLLFSTIGVWTIIPTMLTMHGVLKVICYYLSVQFYSHFQYNGWFIFACLALFFNLDRREANKTERSSVWILYLLGFCTISTYCLSIFWGFPEYHSLLNISVTAAILQFFLTILLFIKNKNAVKEIWNELKPGVKILFAISFGALLVKELLQIIIIYPEMAHASFVLRNYVIAYLHLTFLGVTTVFLLGYAWQKDALIIQSALAKFIIAVMVCCIFLVELFLSVMGSLSWAGIGAVPVFYPIVFICSLSIVIGALIIGTGNLLKLKKK